MNLLSASVLSISIGLLVASGAWAQNPWQRKPAYPENQQAVPQGGGHQGSQSQGLYFPQPLEPQGNPVPRGSAPQVFPTPEAMSPSVFPPREETHNFPPLERPATGGTPYAPGQPYAGQTYPGQTYPGRGYGAPPAYSGYPYGGGWTRYPGYGWGGDPTSSYGPMGGWGGSPWGGGPWSGGPWGGGPWNSGPLGGGPWGGSPWGWGNSMWPFF